MPLPAVAARCAIARCLARQWFGVVLRAATPLDEWLVEGERVSGGWSLRTAADGVMHDGCYELCEMGAQTTFTC